MRALVERTRLDRGAHIRRADDRARRQAALLYGRIEVDGAPLYLLFDTGATAALSDSALAELDDGGPVMRVWTVVSMARLADRHCATFE